MLVLISLIKWVRGAFDLSRLTVPSDCAVARTLSRHNTDRVITPLPCDNKQPRHAPLGTFQHYLLSCQHDRVSKFI